MSFHIRLIKTLFLAFTISLSTAALADEQRFQKLEQRHMELIKRVEMLEWRMEKHKLVLECSRVKDAAYKACPTLIKGVQP